MKNFLASLLWAIVGGFTAFVMGCWLGAMLVYAILFCLGKRVSMAELNDLAGMGILLGLWAGYWCQRLYYRAKLPGYKPENN